jgi:hypothetical protein
MLHYIPEQNQNYHYFYDFMVGSLFTKAMDSSVEALSAM